jgi:serine/threonine-protein kinase HipA
VNSYAELARITNIHSVAPTRDIAALFRHMIFNAAIGNVDDHLKNFWMLGGPKGYGLAPAFDLVPDITGRIQHTLLFDTTNYCPTRLNLTAIANQWNVPQANEIIDRVVEVTNGFAGMAKDLEVEGGENLKRILDDVGRRVETLMSKSW